MHSGVRWICGLALMMVFSGVGRGQERVLRLTLEEAQARALDVSHRLAEGRARESAALAVADARAAADHPLVAVSAGYTRTNHVDPFVVPSSVGPPRLLYPDVPSNYRSRLDLRYN